MWLPGIPHPSNLSSIRCQEVHPDGQEDWSEKWEDEDWSEKSEADEVIDDEIEQAIEQELSKDPLPTGWMSAKKATPSGGISAKKDPPMVKARSSGSDSTSAKSMAASSSGDWPEGTRNSKLKAEINAAMAKLQYFPLALCVCC